MNLGNKIQKIRKDNKISQEAFAEVLNVTRQTVSNWENQKNYPDIETLILISDKYNISLDVLLKGDNQMIKKMNKKIKNYKKLIIVIIMLIVTILLFVAGCYIYDRVYSRIQYYKNINTDNGAFIFTKCNYKGERIELKVIFPASANGKKWYEPFTYDASATKPTEYKVIANWAEPNTEKKVYEEIMSQMNLNVDDYKNSYDLLEDMKTYMTNIGADCD